jgi:serine/threonine protein kinase
LAPIGAGGVGEVYRALETASSLNHPHIVTVHDAGEIEGRQYLITELTSTAARSKDWARPETKRDLLQRWLTVLVP